MYITVLTLHEMNVKNGPFEDGLDNFFCNSKKHFSDTAKILLFFILFIKDLVRFFTTEKGGLVVKRLLCLDVQPEKL